MLALLVQTVGYVRGWAGDVGPPVDLPVVLWYVGFVGLCAPFAALLLARRTSDRDRLLGAVAFTALLYLSWLLANPVVAATYDETQHVMRLVQVVQPDAPVGGAGLAGGLSFPGLELAAGAIHWLTGLPLMACQVAVVLVCRVTLTVALFLLAHRVTGSSRSAGVVVLLYAASAQLYAFNAQFSDQTMALALVVSVLWLLAGACDAAPDEWRWMVAVGLCLAALVVTHQLTSWLTVAGLWALAALFAVGGEPSRARRTTVAAGVGTVLAAAWAGGVAGLLGADLGADLDDARESVLQLAELEGSRAGAATPWWELAVMVAAGVAWLVLLVPATWAALRSRSWRRSPARLLPVVLGLAYPVVLLVAFAASANEVGDRASSYVALATALVVGAWAATRIDRVGLRIAVPVALVLLLGGAVLGSGSEGQRVPGPDLAGAGQRPVDAGTMALAQWTGRYLPSGARIAADTTLSRVLPTVAPVEPVTDAPVPTSAARARELLVEDEVDFLYVDTRTGGGAVPSGAPLTGRPGYDLVLDGPVQVYDVRGLRDQAAVFAARPDPGLPGSWNPWQTLVVGALVLALVAVAATRRRRRPWRAGDAVGGLLVLPTLVVLGALAPLAGWSAVKGGVMATLLVATGGVALWSASEDHWLGRAGWRWAVPALGLAVALALATYAAWQGLLDHPPLPAPGSRS